MSPVFDTDFDDVPSEFPTVKPGHYTLRSQGPIEFRDIDTQQGTVTVRDLTLRVESAEHEENEDAVGLQVRDTFFPPRGPKDSNLIRFKQLAQAAGLDPSRAEAEDFEDVSVRARVNKDRNGYPRVAAYLSE